MELCNINIRFRLSKIIWLYPIYFLNYYMKLLFYGYIWFVYVNFLKLVMKKVCLKLKVETGGVDKFRKINI